MLKFLYILYQAIRMLMSILWTVLVQAWPRKGSVSHDVDPNAPSQKSLRDGHELSDARPKLVATAAAALLVMIFVTMGAVGWMYTHLYGPTNAIPVKRSQENFKNAPHSMTSIEDDWKVVDANAHQRLDGYGWIDPAHGIVRIPIQRAMDLVAAQGLPARLGQTPPPFPPPDEEKLPLTDLETTQHATKFSSN